METYSFIINNLTPFNETTVDLILDGTAYIMQGNSMGVHYKGKLKL